MIEREIELDVGRANGGFDAVYTRERRGMLRLCYLIVGSSQVAEDLVHDAFAELYRRWDHVDLPGAYIRRAVVNRSLSWKRRQHVEGRYLRNHPAEIDRATAPDEPIWAIVRQLSSAQRTALVLVYYLDLSSEDAAEQMGCRPATVRSLVRRGLTILRKEMQ